MDLSGYTNDELADIWKDMVDETHSRIAALSPGSAQSLYETLFNRAHTRLSTFLNALKTGGTVHPDSGGSDKGDGS